MAYIDRDILYEEIKSLSVFLGGDNVFNKTAKESVLRIIDEQPTADVVEVVRCKDCKHLYCCSAVDRMFYCRHHLGLKGTLNPIEENPYCSYGKRKDETIYCKDCKHLMFSDFEGECLKGYKGIVNPDDTCEHAEPKFCADKQNKLRHCED